MKRLDLTAQRFGRLTVLYTTRSYRQEAVCKCQCGTVDSVRTDSLQCGRTRSCGCLSRELLKLNGRPSGCRGEANGKHKITAEDVQEIRSLRQRGYLLREIGEQFAITKAHVSGILKGLCWKHVA